MNISSNSLFGIMFSAVISASIVSASHAQADTGFQPQRHERNAVFIETPQTSNVSVAAPWYRAEQPSNERRSVSITRDFPEVAIAGTSIGPWYRGTN